MLNSISLYNKDRCRTIEPLKQSQDNSPLIYLYRHKSRFIPKPEQVQVVQSPFKVVQNSLPSLQPTTNTSMSQEKEINYQQKLANNLIIKRNETLKAYRIRLRALLDSQFSENIQRIKHKPVNTSQNFLNVRISEVNPKKKLSLMKPAENILSSKAFKIYKPSKDPYFFGNIQQNVNFSSFSSILNIFYDTYSWFTYCGKAPKEANDIKIFFNDHKIINGPGLKPLPVAEIKRLKKLREEFPWARRIYYKKANVDCANKAFIIELACIFSNGMFLEYAAEALRILSGIIHIIFFIDAGYTEQTGQDVLAEAEKVQIKCSGLYVIENTKVKSPFVDFSQVFLDFQCFEPCEDCLVFARHYLEDLEGDRKYFVGKKIGCSIKLNIRKIPLFSQEFPRPPITVSLFMPEIDSDCSNLVKLSEFLMSYLKFNFSLRNLINFQKILKDFEVLESDLPHRSIVSNKVLIDYYQFTQSAALKKDLNIFTVNLFLF